MILAASCSKDTAYDDLDDIDLTIQVGSAGLTIPVGATDRISLTEAMDPSTVDVLDTLPGGDFVITQAGNLSATHFDVAPVTVQLNPTIAPAQFNFNAQLPAGDILTAVNAYLAVSEIQSIDPLSQIAGVSGSTDLNNIHYDNISFDDCHFDFTAHNVDEALLALRSASFATPKEISFDLTMSGLPDRADSYNITLSNVLIMLPPYLNIVGQSAGRIEVGTLSLTKSAGSTSASTRLTYRISGVDFSSYEGGALSVEQGTLSSQGDIQISADAAIDGRLSLSTDDLKLEEGTVKLRTPIVITPTVSVGELTITDLEGRFNPTIDPVETSVTLDLGEDMDFLKENATLDVTNPIITLHLNNPCAVKILGDITLTATNGQAPIVVRNVDLSEPLITISRLPLSEGSNYVASDLSNLLNPMPDRIDVHVAPYADTQNFYPYTLGRNYEISGDYDVQALLSFNELRISYDKVAENVFGDTEEDVQDIADVLTDGIHNAELHFEVINAIPVTLDLSVVATDRNGNEDPTLVTYANAQTIAAGTYAQPTRTTQNITLSVTDVARVKDLILRVQGTGRNITLNARQYIQFENMKLVVKKVTLDLND